MCCSLTHYRNSSFVELTGDGTCNRPKAFIFPSMHKPSLGQTGQHSSPAWGTHLGEGLKPGWTFPPPLEDTLPEQESPLVQRLLLSACQGMAGNQCRLQVSPCSVFSRWCIQCLWLSVASSHVPVTCYYPKVLLREVTCLVPICNLLRVLQALMWDLAFGYISNKCCSESSFS